MAVQCSLHWTITEQPSFALSKFSFLSSKLVVVHTTRPAARFHRPITPPTILTVRLVITSLRRPMTSKLPLASAPLNWKTARPVDMIM